MSGNYQPDNDATAGEPWNVAFLSDRDVSGQVPINFVPHPGVYVTASCFGNGTYDDGSFKECFSNLLASEIRRFIFDVYWDALNRQWRLCPVETPTSSENTTSAEALYTASGLTARQIMAQNTTSTVLSTSNSTLTTTGSQANNATTTITSTSMSSVPTIVSSSGNVLYELGPYRCSDTLGLGTIFSVLRDYITNTSLQINARLQYVIFDVHAAATIQNPTAQRQPLTQSDLPTSKELINTNIGQTGSLAYSPPLLRNDRENLNTSWFLQSNQVWYPLLKYMTIRTGANGDLSTPDGWPCENYVQQESGYRVLIGYGTIDESINGYDYQGDNATIFMPGVLTADRGAQVDDTGSVTSGCFYNSVDNQVSQVNSSWAVSTLIGVDQSILGYAADNLTTCGISPILNYTLGNQAASVNDQPYQSFSNQALFSWASGEPRNLSTNSTGVDSSLTRCALMVSNSTYRGHWRVEDCSKKYRVACREANQPYVWTLSTNTASYKSGDDACVGNSSFGVPRTGLENLYLYNHIGAISSTQQDDSLLDGVWLNFNDLDYEECWVTSGTNGTCPYIIDEDSIRQRQILVPVIAAFITLCITALTILVKCNTNRRKSKVRKRGEGGWDYEGVPS